MAGGAESTRWFALLAQGASIRPARPDVCVRARDTAPLNFSCNKCQRRYSIADEKVRGKTVKVRCKNCQNVISVEGPPVENEESTRVVSLADVERLREQDRSLAEEEAAVASTASIGAQSWEDEPTRTAPVRDNRASWFVMVKSKQEGPLEELVLREMIAAGTLSARSYFWNQSMTDWKRGQDIPELAELFAPAEPPVEAPPPAPARVPPPPPALSRQPTLEPEPELPLEPEHTPEPAVHGSRDSTPWAAEPTLPSPAGRQGGSASRPVATAQPSTPWEPEGEPESAPRDRAAAGDSGSAPPLGELFSDLDLPAEQQASAADGSPEEPLASLGQDSRRQRAYVEETQHIAKKPPAKRGRGLRIAALVVLLLVVLSVGALFALTETQVVPLRVWRTDAAGNPVEQPVSLFSPEGVDALKDLALGQPRPPPPAPKPKSPPSEAPKTAPAQGTAAGNEAAPANAAPQGAAPAGTTPPGDTKTGTSPEAPSAGTTPAEAKPAEAAAQGGAPQGAAAAGATAAQATKASDAEQKKDVGPSPEQIARVLEKSQTAFKSCIDQVLRKNPKLVDTTLMLTTTVDSKGVVRKVAFDRQGIEGSPSGKCFEKSARKLVFPAISRESMEVQIPLVLSRTQYTPPDDSQ